MTDLATALRDAGIPDRAIERALVRREEIADRGMITAEAWRGAIVDSQFDTFRSPQ